MNDRVSSAPAPDRGGGAPPQRAEPDTRPAATRPRPAVAAHPPLPREARGADAGASGEGTGGHEAPAETERPGPVPAGRDAGGSLEGAVGDALLAEAAAAGGLAPALDEYKDGHSPDARFLEVMEEIVMSSPAQTSGAGMKLGGGFGGQQSSVLARLIILARKLSGGENPAGLHHQALLAASLFKANRGDPAAVAMVLDDIDFSTSRNTPIYTVMRGLVLSVSCLCAAALLLFGASSFIHARLAGVAWQDALAGPYLGILTSPLFIAVVFGMLGSVVSILLRLSEFEGATRRSRQFLKMTGAMLPLVGAIFAAVTCALFASGIINFNFAAEPGSPAKVVTNPHFYIVVGFLAGFSERFTRGLLGTAEKALSSATHIQAGTVRTREGSATVVSGVKRTAGGESGQA